MSRFRNAVFTWNTYPDDVADQLTKLPDHTYLVYGYECGESGTPHIQGYVEFKEKVGFNTLKKRFPKVHWENRKGTSQQASDYCKKEGNNIFEEGTMSAPGKRNDLDKVREQLKSDDATLRHITETATSCQSIRFAQIYLNYHEQQRNFKPIVTWLYGKSGTGKTYRARADATARGFGDSIHTQMDNCKWWDGYDAHKVVIIDELRSTFCTYVRMLNILDRYPCRIECKGGSRQLLATHIYITSNKPPTETWETSEEQLQLLRRIDNIEEIISLTESIIHKGDGIPNYQEEAIQEEDNEEQDTTSEFSCEEVCSQNGTESRD